MLSLNVANPTKVDTPETLKSVPTNNWLPVVTIPDKVDTPATITLSPTIMLSLNVANPTKVDTPDTFNLSLIIADPSRSNFTDGMVDPIPTRPFEVIPKKSFRSEFTWKTVIGSVVPIPTLLIL